jgi:ribonuclease VapC
MSVGSLLEAAIVADSRRDPVVSRRLDDFMAEAEILIEPVTADQTRIGREAYRDFGKGSAIPS